ncbi:hypothetical protein ALC62_09651 [Cyphomyrmex costatus]|uniref:Uncharacterized protein n=1 Tax=Cyphomyrmex costatus TaxID=456900 RepID=A0A151IFB4_9HYME|nr:hypothetical protein ALC62_09651 [Cyphomyrmex costatus]
MPGPCEKCKGKYTHLLCFKMFKISIIIKLTTDTNARIVSAVTIARAAIPDAKVIFIIDILFPSRIDERERAPPSNCTLFFIFHPGQ